MIVPPSSSLPIWAWIFSGIVIGRALDLDLVNEQRHHAAGPLARGLTLEVDRHLHLDPVRLAHAQEVDVDRLDAVGVPLEFADQGGCLDGALEFDHPAAVADDRLEGLALGGQFDALFAVAVENGGHEPLAAEPAALAGTVALRG